MPNVNLQIRQGLPPIRAYVDDLTSTIPLLRKIYENITWARKKFKPTMSRSIAIIRGKPVYQSFHTGHSILLVSEQPVKRRWNNQTSIFK